MSLAALLSPATPSVAARANAAPAHRLPPQHVAAQPLPARPVVTFAAPSGNIPAGHVRGATYDAVLPSGRIVVPAGESVVTGMNALGVALSPDGRFAIVSNDDEREAAVHSLIDSGATGGFSLAVVELATMRVVDRYRAAGERFWIGVAALPDPADTTRTLVLASGGPTNVVYALDLDASGHLTADATHVITPPAPGDD
ncbi:MAG: hypothetical protein M3154_07535, partial [Candidatus Eremiobacteraeota bacterium]|nr:hypothetical protein [Candidatus Eremiobacteraeota bacterium]